MTKKTLRDPRKKVKTARGRKNASTRWLDRQLNDPYVARAEVEGYRSRAAFKILEIDEKANILAKDQVVVDLGAAPGGWSQVAAAKGCKVIALDILDMDDIPDVTFFKLDFTDDSAPDILMDALGGAGVDVVLSDLAPNTTGHKNTDHLKIIALVEMAYDFAIQVLKPGGTFLAKVRQGGADGDLLAQMKRDFSKIKHIKPPSSRKESSETFVVATGFGKKN